MSMKVCKLVRLTQKNDKGLFVKGEKGAQVVLRSRCIVSEATVAEFDANHELKGLLYIVDEKKTAQRDKIVAAEAEARAKGIDVVAAVIETPVEEEVEQGVEEKLAGKAKEDDKGKAGAAAKETL